MPDYKDVCSGPAVLTSEDRNKIISRIHSLLFWVGETIPQEVRIEDRTVPLRDVVYNYLISENPTEEERKDAEVLAELLDKHVKEIEVEIRSGSVGRAEACGLMNEARSFLRAVDELRTSKGEEAEFRRHDLMNRVEDARRWQRFIDRVK
jgi:Family of unknown function (DUF5788)